MSDRRCNCPVIVGVLRTPDPGPCPLHVGYADSDGIWWRRAGDSDVTGGPYYVGAPLELAVRPTLL